MTKLLIIDDNIPRRDKLIKKLKLTQEYNYIDIKFCDSADKARVLCKSNRYEILILDICLPRKVDENSDEKNGLELLEDLNNDVKYFTPVKIIGITADEKLVLKYSAIFMKYTAVLYHAPYNETEWILNTIANISKVANSKITEQTEKKNILVISIHGISTYGQWQNDLSEFIQDKTRNVVYQPFNYGLFSILYFIFPFARYLKARSVNKKIYAFIKEHEDKEIYIFAHSYGTYIISQLIESNMFKNKITSVILAGSVLPSRYNLKKKFNGKVEKVINDCGSNDFPLILNRIFVPFLGDSGRVGFCNMNEDKLCNRFFKGGHSLFFQKTSDNENFMEKYWIPCILDEKELKIIDERKNSTIIDDLKEPLISILSLGMTIFYLFLIYKFIFIFIE